MQSDLIKNVPSPLPTQLNHQKQPQNHQNQLQTLTTPIATQNLNLELNNQTTNLEQFSPSLPFQNLSPRSQRSIYTDISSPFTSSILSPHSPHFTPNPHYMSPDSQYLSSNSILSPFSQHLSPHPNNFTTQTTNPNSSLHIYADAPRSGRITSGDGGGKKCQISRHENIPNNLNCNSNNIKLTETPALPNILATLDNLTNQQNQKDFSNRNQNIPNKSTTISQKCDFQKQKFSATTAELNNSSVITISQQYIPPSATLIPKNIENTTINKDLSTKINHQQDSQNNVGNLKTVQSINNSPLVKDLPVLPIMYNENQPTVQSGITSQNSTVANLPNSPAFASNDCNQTISKTSSELNNNKIQQEHQQLLQLPLNSPTPSLPEFDFLPRNNDTQNNKQSSNILDIFFKEPGSVTSYYSAPANLGSERVLDDFANVSFPNFFREHGLNTPKNSHGNLEDFYTEQLQNFLDGQVMSFNSNTGQNCSNNLILNNHLVNSNNAQNLSNSNCNALVNSNGESMEINANISNSNSIDNHNEIISKANNGKTSETSKELNPSQIPTQSTTKNNNGSSKSHFKPSLLETNKMLLSEHYINKIILFECKLCGKYYKNERSYSKHQKVHGEGSPKCQYCGKYFQSRKRFLNHDQNLCKTRQGKRSKSRITENKLKTENVKLAASCNLSEENISKNIQNNNNNNNNKSEINQNSSNNNINNNNKIDDTKKDNSNSTQIVIKNPPQSENHTLPQKTGEEIIKEQPQQPIVVQQKPQPPKLRKELNKTPKQCQYCPRTFIREAHLRTHEKNHDIVFKCDHCPRTFRFKNACQSHMRIHTGEKPYKCDICPAAFATSSNLKAHQLIHTDEKPFECTFGCGKAFSTKRLRKWHEPIHTGEKPYKCEICDKHFAMQSRLSLHRKQRHMDKNLRPHECTICSKRFLHPTGLRDHMNIHNGDKPYECPFDNCDKRFPNQNRLWEHKKLHPIVSYKQRHHHHYICQICNKSFTQYSGMEMHKKFCNDDNNLLLSQSSLSSSSSLSSIGSLSS